MLNFEPTAGALTCPYCGFVEKIDPAASGFEEHDFQQYLSKQAEHTPVEGHSSEVRCDGCGAVVLLEDKVATDRCPFCGAALTNAPQAAQTMIAPESLLPMAVSKAQAIASFNQWIAGRWFAPTELKRFANLGQLFGIYVPYWTYDSMTYTQYAGMRGDDYSETETYVATNSQGQSETRTRLVTRTVWSPVGGRVDHFFDDVLVCASKSLPEHLVSSLSPWDLKALVGFKADYLAGFKTERYGVALGEGFNKARAIMDETIRQLCCQEIGGNHQNLTSVNTQHVGVTFKHLLLPIWLAAYRYQNETYRILVNARTGRLVGTRPYSWIKIAALVMAILALVIVVVLASNQN